MCRRKVFVRGVVFTIIAVCACLLILYERFTNPAAVRSLALSKLQVMFPGAHVTVNAARLRPFGGINVLEIRLARGDDPDHLTIAHIPSAILYHDKEKVLDGELSLRKIELFRPHLRVVRGPDGAMNLAGLTGNLQPDVQLPTLVIHHGTLVIDNSNSGGRPLEIHDVNLTIINDPADVVAIEGSANSDVGGTLHITGQWLRQSGNLLIQLQAHDFTLSRFVVDALTATCRDGGFEGLRLGGKVDLQATLAFTAGQAEPLKYDIAASVREGSIGHPRLPFPLENVRATLHAGNAQVRVDQLCATSGKAQIEGHGSAPMPLCDRSFEAHFEVKHLDIGPEMFATLPEKLQALGRNFKPAGPVSLKVDCARYDGTWIHLLDGGPSRALLMPEALSICFNRFEYPLQGMTGSIDHDFHSQRTLIDLTGLAGNRPVTIQGSWQGEASQVDAHIDIRAENVLLDKTLLEALPPPLKSIAKSFHPTGKVDVKAHIAHSPGEAEKDYRQEYHVRFHEGTVQWDGFPYPLEKVSGFIDIYAKSFQIRDCQGTRAGGLVSVQGRSVPVDGKPLGLILEITGQNILLDETLQQALTPIPGLVKAWDTFRPRGRLHFAAAVDRSTGRNEDVDVRVEVRGGDVEPTFFPYTFQDVTGLFRFCKNHLDVARLSAGNGKARISIDKGSIDLTPRGGYYADLKEVEAQGITLDGNLIQALPHELRAAATALHMRDPVSLKSRLVVAQDADPSTLPDIFWDGQVILKDARLHTGLEWSRVSGIIAAVGRFHRRVQGINGNFMLEKATLLGQPFHDIHGKFQVRKDAPDVVVAGVTAPLFGGEISGQLRADFRSSTTYELNLTASQIDLAEFGKHNLGSKSSLGGQLLGRLHLNGDGTGVDSLDGSGSLDVPSGKILDLPLLSELLKILGVRSPDRTLFEEMHALFAIRGRRLAVRRLELVGNVVSLYGKGEVNLDGSDVQLDFYPSWARVEQILPPAVRAIPPVISKNLLTIEARGKVSSEPKDLKFYKKPFPVIVDPLLLMRDRLLGNSTIDRPPLQAPMKKEN